MKIEISITSRKARFIAVLAAVLLVTSITVYALALTPSFTTIVQPGSQVSQATYIVFTDGTNFFARNGQTAAIDYSGSTAAAVLQNAIDNARTVGPKIFIQHGTYALGSTSLLIYSAGLRIEGEETDLAGSLGTILTYTGSNAALNISNGGGTRIQRDIVSHLTIMATGGAVSSATATGIYISTVEGLTVDRVVVRDFNSGTGINVTTQLGASKYTAQVTIHDSFIVGCKFGLSLIGLSSISGVNTVQMTSTAIIGQGIAGSIGVLYNQWSDRMYVAAGDVESVAIAYSMKGNRAFLSGTRTEAITGTHILFASTAGDNTVMDHSFVGGGTYVTDNGPRNVVLHSPGYDQVWGVVRSAGNLTGQTTTQSNICSYTPNTDGIFSLGGFVDVTAYTSGSIKLHIVFTDFHGTSTQVDFVYTSGATSASSVGWFSAESLSIYDQNARSITISTTGPFVLTYDVGCWIQQTA